MPKHKSLVVGHRIVNAGKLRRCYHDRKHLMPKGSFCLEVRDGLAWKGYCASCAAEMINQAATQLADLQTRVPDADATNTE